MLSDFHLRFRPKLILLALAFLAPTLLAVYFYFSHVLSEYLHTRIQKDLSLRLNLAERMLSLIPLATNNVEGWDALADDIGFRAMARAIIIRRDGKVLGDSKLTADEVARAENHASRPEVQMALTEGRGMRSRYSKTLKQQMLYVSQAFRQKGTTAGVITLALPLIEIDEALRRLRLILGCTLFIALGLALALSSMAIHRASLPLRQITQAARKMIQGDLSIRLPVEGHDETAELGRDIDQLARNLSQTIEELRAERDLLSQILASQQEGVLILDKAGRIVMINQALRSMLLLSSEAIGKVPLEVIRHAKLQSILEQAKDKQSSLSEEIEVGGLKPRSFIVRAGVLPKETGGMVAMFIDVTDIRRLESLRRDFVANASHELRTPVTAIRTASETLQNCAYQDPEAAMRFLAVIHRHAERMQHIIDDLLDLSRIESRELNLHLEALVLAPIVEHIGMLFKDKAEAKGIVVRTVLPNSLPSIRVDRRALEHILSNLLDNAIKYANEQSVVAIKAEALESMVQISVDDTGPGIEAQHLPRLFERFYRVDSGRSRDIGGTGLGLALAKHLIEAMGGTITVESTLGQGSSFIVKLARAS
jgi:two-component system phosphate regulon sensor histidine kinase PhoR